MSQIAAVSPQPTPTTGRANFWASLREFFFLFRVLWFIPILLGFGFFALLRVEQLQEYLDQLNRDSIYWLRKSTGAYFEHLTGHVLVLLGALWWAVITWFSSRLILLKARIPTEDASTLHRKWHAWTPRIVGVFPFLILAVAFASASADGPNPLSWWRLTGVWGSLVFAGLFIWAMWFEGRAIPATVYQAEPWDDLLKVFRDILSTRTKQVLPYVLGGALVFGAIVVILLTLNFQVGDATAGLLGTVGVVEVALGFWTLVLAFLAYLDNHLRLPITVAVGLWVVGLSTYNNNHAIRELGQAKPAAREPADVYLQKWLQAGRINDTVKTYPILIVAAEGGGIRAAYWAASLLARLNEACPGFTSHVFAISGASGGSLGAATFVALQADSQRHLLPPLPASSTYPPLVARSRQMLGKDFLSPLTAGFLFPDLMSKLSPAPIAIADRARRLEDSWAREYPGRPYFSPTLRNSGNTFDDDFLNLWQLGQSYNYQLPALLLNCTRAETGEKVIVSNMLVSSKRPAKQGWFNLNPDFGAIDLLETNERPVALKTAVSMSARFPLVTPAALVETHKKGDDRAWANIVDGGYVDNSGMSSALTLVNMIHRAEQKLGVKLPVCVLFLKNSDSDISDPFKADSVTLPLTMLYETRVIMSAFYKAWERGTRSQLQGGRTYFELFDRALDRHDGLKPIELSRKNGRMPLGWYLGSATCRLMDSLARREVDLVRGSLNLWLQDPIRNPPPR